MKKVVQSILQRSVTYGNISELILGRGHISKSLFTILHNWLSIEVHHCTKPYETLLPAATKLGQGNVFTSVCDSVHGGGSASVHAGMPAPPGLETPPGPEAPLGPGRPPQTRQTPPLGPDTPPGKQTPAYGQWAAGTHPTGMHSCFKGCSL